jgi:hypothetical protein
MFYTLILEVSLQQRESRTADACVGEHEAFSTVLHAKCIKLDTAGLLTLPAA